MKQHVVVTRLADRHATLHDRDYADSWQTVVQEGPAWQVLATVTDRLRTQGPETFDSSARYSITIGEPYE